MGLAAHTPPPCRAALALRRIPLDEKTRRLSNGSEQRRLNMPSNKTLGKWAMAREKRKLVLNVTPDIREWVEKQAGERRMTMSEYCMRLMTRGIRAEETDQAVERLRTVYSAPALDAVMKEMLA